MYTRNTAKVNSSRVQIRNAIKHVSSNTISQTLVLRLMCPIGGWKSTLSVNSNSANEVDPPVSP